MKRTRFLKKVISIVTVVAAVFNSMCASVFADEPNLDMRADLSAVVSAYIEEYPEDADVLNDVFEDLVYDPNFKIAYEDDKEYAVSAFKNCLVGAINDKYGIQAYAGDFSCTFWYSLYEVPVINQIKSNYCGPASILEALIGYGELDNVASNKNITALNNEFNAMGSPAEGPAINVMMKRLNNRIGLLNYGYNFYTSHSYSGSIDYLVQTFQSNIVPIVYFADTSALNYYNGKKFSHYITVESVNTIKREIVLVDPHFDATYRGKHTITFDEFYNAMKLDNGIMNCAIIGTSATANHTD